LECVIASVILALAVVGIMMATLAGVRHLDQAETQMLAVRVAEDLIEEIVASPYESGGAQRPDWSISDYHGFQEDPGSIRDFSGALYGDEAQGFARTVSVTDATQTVAELGGLVVDGKMVEVSVTGPSGQQWLLSRFVPEPAQP
jgi:Tfp pilus assembly protein PilV